MSEEPPEPCPDCDGTGKWLVAEPHRSVSEDARVIREHVEDCPFCGGTSVKGGRAK